MTRRIVVACFGDAQSAEIIRQMSSTADVVAVALDFGGAVSLTAMRDVAVAAGAVRCHALDVREEFARESLLPAVRARAFADPTEAFATLAPEFAASKLAEIAALEGAATLRPESVTVSARPIAQGPEPLHLEIAFEDGLPVSINGVPMTLTELMESIETITGEPALHVLDREMAKSREHQLA